MSISEIKPSYYDEFRCVADKCSFTCCKDWKISVDENTKKKWKKLDASLIEHVISDNEMDKIQLEENGNCPFLLENGLCTIVCKYGEEAISHTCHTFPRERHVFKNKIEYVFTMGCPEALRLLWNRDKFEAVSIQTGNKGDVWDTTKEDLFDIRDRYVELVQNEEYSVKETLLMCFFMELAYYQKWDNEGQCDEAFLYELKNAVNNGAPDEFDNFMEQNELFLDIAENYRKKRIYTGTIEPLVEAAEEIEGSEDDDDFIDGILNEKEEFEAVWNSYEKKIRLLIAEEMFSTLILPNASHYTMTFKLQWIGLFYAVLKQMLFLQWKKNGSLNEKDLYDITTVLIRMTGYSEDDIEEYLENSFEDVIWEWGYMALIL